MKLKINRETTIGLSVLLVLMVVLGVVAVRRFFRPHIPHEEIVALEEAKLGDEQAADRAKHEMEWPRKPESLSSVAPADRDSMPPSDNREHWKNAVKERKRETPADSPAASLIASDPPAISDTPRNVKPERREHERTQTDSPSAPSLTDDRYSMEATSHEKNREFQPTTPTGPFADSRATAGSRSMVVQVGGDDQADRAPRSPDRYAGELPSHESQREHRDPGSFADSVRNRRQMLDILMARPPACRSTLRLPASLPANSRPRSDEPRNGESKSGCLKSGGSPVRAARAPAMNRRLSTRRPAMLPPSYAGVADGERTVERFSASQAVTHPTTRCALAVRFPVQCDRRTDSATTARYEVQPNDSYWTISERVYGSGAYFRALAEQNRGKAARPDRLPPGLVISTPPVAQLEKDYPDLCPRPESPRNGAKPGRSAARHPGCQHGQHGRRRADLRRAGRRHACRASPATSWERSRAGRKSISSIARRWARTTIISRPACDSCCRYGSRNRATARPAVDDRDAPLIR